MRRGFLAPLVLAGLEDDTSISAFGVEGYQRDDINSLADGRLPDGTAPDAITRLAALAVAPEMEEVMYAPTFTEKYLNQQTAVAANDAFNAFSEEQWGNLAEDGVDVSAEDMDRALASDYLTEEQRKALTEVRQSYDEFDNALSDVDYHDLEERRYSESLAEVEASKKRVGVVEAGSVESVINTTPAVSAEDITPAADLDPNKFSAMSELATVKKGEGPYHSVQRLLGEGADHDLVLDIAHKIKAYIKEQTGRDLDNGSYLKVGEALLTEDLLKQLIAEYPELKERYESLST